MPDGQDFRLPSLRGRVSEAEWEARVDLAAAYRLTDLYGMSDLIANHISLRVPDEEGAFLINSYGMLYEEITASSLTKIDLDGNVLLQPEFPPGLGYDVNRAGFVIHAAVHRARPDMHCVAHTHTWPGMAISMLECGLLPANQTAMRFAHIAYHDFNGVVLDLSEQERLVRDLGDSKAMILRNHGLLTCGATVQEAWNDMHRLELSCKAQLAAMATGAKLIEIPADVVEKTYMNYQPQVRRPFGKKDWPAMLRKLDKIDPSYRT
ncbi:MAG TPA: class II aldolase/adducin family protein [Roseomonas sp.]